MLTGRIAWTDGMAVEAVSGTGHRLVLDAAAEHGGANRGPRPKELTLLSLGGCTAMDVLAILRKMRQPLRAFSIDLEADTQTEHPQVFTAIRLVYRLEGEGLSPEAVEKAIRLSQERYCGVTHMLNKTARIQVAYEVNGVRRELPQAS